eukprot:10884908-Alexandrium_andersonii.AAC.1
MSEKWQLPRPRYANRIRMKMTGVSSLHHTLEMNGSRMLYSRLSAGKGLDRSSARRQTPATVVVRGGSSRRTWIRKRRRIWRGKTGGPEGYKRNLPSESRELYQRIA